MPSKNFQFMLDPTLDTKCLRQGDIIERNEKLAEALNSAHGYYATAEEYEYFIILTPSCQLIKRNGAFSSRYITLAAIRPLGTYIKRELKKFEKKVSSIEGSIYKKDKEIYARQLMERIIHNTQDGYLFLPGEFFPDNKDRIAFLLLSVAIRITEHYEACLGAKRYQLSDSFSAKVGHLTSDLYGQIATQAIEEQIGINPSDIFEEYYNKFLYSSNMHWLSEERISRLKTEAKKHKDQTGSPVTESALPNLVQSIPTDGQILAERLLAAAEKADIVRKNSSTKKRQHFLNELLSDPIVRRVARLD